MNVVVAAWLAAAAVVSQPLTVDVTREREVFSVDFALVVPLPAAFEAALPSGAVVRVVYPLQLRSRRALWWDRRVWRGEAVTTAVFDPVTGRYRCELALDEVIVASQEYSAVDDARQWLVDPPAVRLSPANEPDPERLRVRVRAVFSSTTTWLVFPSVEGTEWVEVSYLPESANDATDDTVDDRTTVREDDG